jgi:UDP-4-keto-D-FucNAc 4-reductase
VDPLLDNNQTSARPLRVVVTGASGFVGRALCASARVAGHEVLGLSRGDAALAGGYEDVGGMERACQGAHVVVHLAARAHQGGSDADFECNVRVTRAVAQAAGNAGVPRVVLLSSIGVNGNVTRGKPFTEADAPAPMEPYARSKLRCEQELRAGLEGSGTQWVIVRPPLVYGPSAPGNFTRLAHAVASGLPLPLGAIRNQRTLVGIGNLCDALLLCATKPAAANQLLLVADDEDLSTPEIIRCIARGLQRPARLWNLPPALLRLTAAMAGRSRMAQSLCDSLQVDASRARHVLDWSPAVPPRHGIAQAARDWNAA